ncbi:hypothetical protein [Spiroplasma endosymbiont of 'Nebria riversi']|uniref:hypothetical protein n=1 Tax=Spiroplasma endosymbiont of 'Nebria riversi' TaxID=2792084 RepID=UPI001C05322A|nr:hypothetical protein [Spiroplasma endosymbiont of 'Nebria riversi']
MEKIIQELVNTLTDDQFLEFYEKVKQQAELIKKQKRLNEIDQKFRAHGIKCPKCWHGDPFLDTFYVDFHFLNSTGVK